MAGERMVAGKYVEISAVCTHPDRRGVGYGRLLMEHLTASIQQRGQTPLLHVFPTNTGAIELYRALGYRIARKFRLTVITLAQS
jgi:predicted GNAT family acetyltransferase